MSILSSERQAEAHNAARVFRSRRIEAAREAYWGVRDGQATQIPAGLVKLESPEERDIWMRFVSRQAMQEQDGAVDADIASTMMQHPDVLRGFEEEVARGDVA